MSAASVLSTTRANLFAVCETALPSFVVVYGPADDSSGIDDLLEIRDASVREVEGQALLSNQRRRRFDFDIDCRVVVSRGGGEEVQQAVTEAALAAVGTISDYLQDSGVAGSTQVNLGGAVEWARVTSVETTDEDEDIDNGRTTYASFTVSGRFIA